MAVELLVIVEASPLTSSSKVDSFVDKLIITSESDLLRARLEG